MRPYGGTLLSFDEDQGEVFPPAVDLLAGVDFEVVYPAVLKTSMAQASIMSLILGLAYFPP